MPARGVVCLHPTSAVLGTDPAGKQLLYPAHLQRVVPVGCEAAPGLNKGQGEDCTCPAAPRRCPPKMFQVKGCDLQQLICLWLQPSVCQPAALTATNSSRLGRGLNRVLDFFLVLVWGKKKRWKCLRWRVGLCYVCTLFLYYLHMIITMKLRNGGCNVGLQGFSCPSPPGPFCDFSHSFVAFWLVLNCKALVAGTTSFMYPRSASDNGALAAMRAFGSACHKNYRRE